MFKRAGKTRVRTFGLWLVLTLLLSACQPIMPVPAQPPAGLRPDAPTYAVHGPFAVGARDFVIGEGDDAIQMTVWYPALNSQNAKEKITYHLSEKVTSIPPLPAAARISFGMALQDAKPDSTQAPYPLVVFSVGLAGFRQQNSYLFEHLASYGMVVLSGDPRGETLFGEFWAGAATRQIDPQHMIDYADELTASGGKWAGLIDTEHIAMAGHSSGGWTANRTETVVGLSNLFTPPADHVAFWAGCVATVQATFPGLPLVGNESGPDLVRAEAVGFEKLQSLRVWGR